MYYNYDVGVERGIESVVEYSCEEGYKSAPSTANTTYTCVASGPWTHDEFECLKGFKSL